MPRFFSSLDTAYFAAQVPEQDLSVFAAPTALTDASIVAGSVDGTTGNKIPVTLFSPYIASKNPRNLTVAGTDGNGNIIAGTGGGGLTARAPNGFTGYTWYNQGSSTVSALASGELYVKAQPAAGTNITGITVPLPTTTPYTVDIVVDPFYPNVNYWSGGMIMTNASGGVVLFAFDRCQSFTAYNSAATNVGTGLAINDPGPAVVFRLSNDGTNMAAMFSRLGKIFFLSHSGLPADFLTPTSVGIGINPFDSAATGTSASVGLLDYHVSTTALSIADPFIRPLL